MRLYGMGAMVMDFGDNPLLWIIGATIAALSLFFKAVIGKWGGESADYVKNFLHRIYFRIKTEPVACFALLGLIALLSYVCAIDQRVQSDGRNKKRIWGPYRVDVCDPKEIDIPVEGSSVGNYAVVMGGMKINSYIMRSGEDNDDNAIFGVGVSGGQTGGAISVNFYVEINSEASSKSGSLNSCSDFRTRDFVSNVHRSDGQKMYADVFLIYMD